jgi:Bax protein
MMQKALITGGVWPSLCRLSFIGLCGLGAALSASPAAASPVEHGAAAAPLPAFHRIEHTDDRKDEFFRYLTPLIRDENVRILAERRRLLTIRRTWESGRSLSAAERRFVAGLARQYRLESARSFRGLLDELARRVDVIPHSLALAQAAKESGWGSSRFARQANNLFGQWCFQAGCGLVPRQRPPGATHEVQRFPTVQASVRSYLRNLNSHPGYEPLRALRADLRAQREPLCGVRLAQGLEAYSALGEQYVREVQVLIVQNELEAAWTGPTPGGSIASNAR